ncbi:porin family protein [Dyadobacter sp. CY347]|uniref:porin family protein n=1 Tax=Dyadobacter sp. CY347 TaxID=2909336 RepID=UPI001F3FDAAB|nr:porin family protein [Dyadobacter sp. CY347]MCF2489568.1 PorT family protein [Dyadobacter sp. CY347]
MRTSTILFRSLILLMLFSTYGQAQKLKYGIKGGVNVSDFSLRTNAFSQGIKNIWKPMILSHVGGYVEKPLNQTFAVQAELLYSINGSNVNLFKSYAHYLSIPMLLNVHFRKGVILELGPQISFIHASKRSLLLMNSKVDFGMTVGCRVNVSPSVNIGLRCVQGLAPLSNLLRTVDSQGNAKVLRDFYSRNIQLSVAYQLSKH